jgi:hypothetical protein
MRLIQALLLKRTFSGRAEEDPCGSTGFLTPKGIARDLK